MDPPIPNREPSPLVPLLTDWRNGAGLEACRAARAAVSGGTQEALERLHGHSVWREWRSSPNRSTWLHIACQLTADAETVLPFLLRQGLDMETPNRSGSTPLHQAFYVSPACRTAWVPVLVAAGANPHALDANGRSCWHGALRTGTPDVVEWLAQLGVRPTPADLEGIECGARLVVLEPFWRIHGKPTAAARGLLLEKAFRKGSWGLAAALLMQAEEADPLPDLQELLALVCANGGSAPSCMGTVVHLVERGADPHAPLEACGWPNGYSAWGMASGRPALQEALAEGQRRCLEKRLMADRGSLRKRNRL